MEVSQQPEIVTVSGAPAPQSRGVMSINVGGSYEDDEFFHLTCHVEASMKQKIERGEFIELDKLLPKVKSG